MISPGQGGKGKTTKNIKFKNFILFIKNLVLYLKIKYINIYHYFIREYLDNEDINVKFISTDNMIIDILIKSLKTKKYGINTFRLSLKDI